MWPSGPVAYTCTVQVRDKWPTHTQNARTIFAQTRVKKRVPKHVWAHLMSVFPFVIHSHNRPLCCILLHNKRRRRSEALEQGWLIAAGAYTGFCSMKRLEVFLLPLDRMLVHRRSLPRNFARFPQQFAGTHLYTWVERGTVRVKCLAQEHSTMSPARARTQTARSGVKRTNHEATAPPTTQQKSKTKGSSYKHR